MGIFWQDISIIVINKSWVCGYCGDKVASNVGYDSRLKEQGICIRICPGCEQPTFFDGYSQTPQHAPGETVKDVPTDLHRLYDEARNSSAAGAYTGAVMICRKILMNVAVDNGAQPGESFLHYIDHLDQAGYLPPGGKKWVDYIRTRANEANHEIQLMNADDAQALITFVEMLLKFIYQFPNMVPQASGANSP